MPKHGELLGGERWDKPSAAWVRADEWQRRQWAREDAVFARKANQGELCAPMIISDSLGFRGVQSQVDGEHYDSKRRLRQHYRETGMVEVGNDVPKTRFVHGDYRQPHASEAKAREAAVGKAVAGVQTMSDETVKRRAYERRQLARGN